MAIKSFDEVVREVKGKAILVANRGISGRRICRSVRERFDAVAVMTATDVDKTAPAASAAQELMLLGPDPRAYLDIERILTLAKRRGVIAVHPGWGFASEDDRFPKLCAEAGLVFIGSSTESMRLLGNKVQVRKLAQRLDIPVVPGSDDSVDVPTARKAAASIGFPIMLKAEGGGGGRGIFEVHNEKDLEDAFFKASAMAQASFGNPRVYVEKFLTKVQHIEIQVIADRYGNVFAFDERDCSVQRNNQKLIEITPSPWKGMTPELRLQLKDYATALVRAVGYYSLCTVEFLVTEDGRPYLIEVNTRLQVEHGITECRYGIDLVEEQISVALGGRLRFTEGNTRPVHHAMQVRINCEDPQKAFAPNAGLITRYVSPGGPGVRLDSNLSAGYEFPSNYDSAGALLIAYGDDWTKIRGIMDRALGEYIVGGVKTTIPFHRQVIQHERFRAGDFDTRFIAHAAELTQYLDIAPEAERLARLTADISARGYNQFVGLGEYRNAATPRMPDFAPSLPPVTAAERGKPSLYPKNRKALLDFLRDFGAVHLCDTTCRDCTQSNSGNRFRLAEDELLGPYLDNMNFFSLETGGGAHFHVAMLSNMTNPFAEAREWNRFAPKTMKQILVRSTNSLGYKPQPKNLMRRTAEKVCEEFQVIRCFDFLNHVDNMRPFAEVALASEGCVFEPAISLSWGPGFTVKHYLEVAAEILRVAGKVSGLGTKDAARSVILGLKDMAGVCPPRFMTELVTALRKKWPELVLHCHRHYTDGLFVPSMGAAAKAGAHIVDVSLGAASRWYGQGEVLSTAAYLEDELGLTTLIDKDMVRKGNFVLKQIAPWYDRYVSPYFQGIDHDVIYHGMPGGATSSSQEGAMKQGYIHLLPQILRFLAGTRRIVRYHDVTPGSQITWNTAFLAVTSAFKRGGAQETAQLLDVLEQAALAEESGEATPALEKARLAIYRDCNDAFRDLLAGRFGKLPLGFPPDWVYQSAFGEGWEKALAGRTEESPLKTMKDVDFTAERKSLEELIHREVTDEEFLMYLNHPADALRTLELRQRYGDSNRLPLNVWFEGLRPGDECNFTDSQGKPHHLSLLDIQAPDANGVSVVRYVLDSELMSTDVRVAEAASGTGAQDAAKADPANKYHVPAPSNGDLWVMYVKPGDLVKRGDELFNVSIMKQEKTVLAPVDGLVLRVLKSADYQARKEMTPVREGELLVELGPVPRLCPNAGCGKPLTKEGAFCPHCGSRAE